ncbi:transcriptional Coactivator p15-domain-containing protein [Lentinula guzmanii]|uniref:Transcriptional Coactivator p15-domain-containing protein n=1 Tax=Lentinula guzmanii TaxID=2804957 RepID=A0AA38JNR9_9AGAR|nr:transcriptional Coactivator p15-domain-containing protein [Lentinula guzmanii]
MAKRKTDQERDDSDSAGSPVVPLSKPKLGRGVKKPKIMMQEGSESEQGEEEEEKHPKKKEKSKPVPSSSGAGRSVEKNHEGDRYIDLGKKKRATVRSFKGTTFVDIREFYGDSEESMKPGKKGISLTPEQWEVLKNGATIIDELFAAEQKKK